MFKFIGRHWQSRRERFYLKNRWHLILDFSLGIIIILLASVLISLYLYHPDLKQLFSKPLPEKIEFDVNNPPLVLNFNIASSSIKLSDGIDLKVELKNNSKLDVSEIKTNLGIVDKNFVISKIENKDKASNIEINNQNINFGSLNANESREIIVHVNFKSKDDSIRVIKWQAQNEYSVQNQIFKDLTILTDINLAAELDGSAIVFYNSPQGDQLGSGPLPPLVGLPTNYWVFFEIKSSGDFKNLVFSAKLPQGVELTDRRSLLSGEFKYNASSRQVIWTIPELKNQSDSYRVGFQIQFIPSLSQVGKIPTLLSNIKYYAQDTLIKEDNYSDLPDISANLDFDKLNKGQGEVSKP